MRNFTIAIATTLALASAAAMAAAQGSAQQPPTSQTPSAQPPSSQPPATQAPPRQSPPQSAEAKLMANGELVRVDTKAKTFTIRAASPSASAPGAPSAASAGMPTEFTYNDSTKVTGSEKTVEGLATMSGTEVTVHYTKQVDKNLATEIEIHAQKKS